MNQRWLLGRESRRPAGEPIVTRIHEVLEIPDDTTARAFVKLHHYSRAYCARRFRFGLYERGELVGVAVFGLPPSQKASAAVLPTFATSDVVDLARFVLLDRVPGNGETWFLGRCFAALRGRVAAVTSSSDPHPRTTTEGRVIMPGHVGTIYQAHNGLYRGLGSSRLLFLLPDGSLFSERTWSKIRSAERGWHSGAQQLVRLGARQVSPEADRRARMAWLRRWLPILTRRFKHPGCHRYTWILDPKRRGEVPYGPLASYPKRDLP